MQEHRGEMEVKEYENAYRTAFYYADEKSRRATQHAAAIVDPRLGEEWWR